MFAPAQFTHAVPLHQTLATTLALTMELAPELRLERAPEPVQTLEHRLFPVTRVLETTVEAARFATFARVEGFAI